MPREKTTKKIPDEIKNLVFKKMHQSENYSADVQTHHYLKECLINFCKEKGYYRALEEDLYKYQNIPRQLKRGLNKGAVKGLRDILCLYATEGSSNWDQLISERFPEYSELLDDEQAKFAIKNTKDEPEKKLVQKQISDESHENQEDIVITDEIIIPSKNNPKKPEFPPNNPKFPATETKRIEVPGFNNVWIKDESTNPTGTHKDRMAWEVIVLLADEETNIPEISLISSGSAAIAIQNFLKKFKLNTKLKVLVDQNISDQVEKKLKNAGIELYHTDLSEKELSSKEIKKLTDNTKGIDITYRENTDFRNKRYYDWMSYEILNIQPDYCFIPFGTGDLFVNVLNVLVDEIKQVEDGEKHDPRFRGSIKQLRKCHFWGATTNKESSQMDKLYSYFLPHLEDHKKFIKEGIRKGLFGSKTDIKIADDKFVKEALQIANDQGISCEASGIAGLALLLQSKEQLSPENKYLIVNTGKTDYQIDP